MRIQDIKVGMVFKENDKRFNRWVMIHKVKPRSGTLELRSSLTSPLWDDFGERITISTSPGRFHAEKRSSGYSLV